MACSYGKIFIPPTYDIGKFKRDLGKRASSLSHMNAMKFFIGKQLRGEIIGRRDVPLSGIIRTGPKINLFDNTNVFFHINYKVVSYIQSN